jgi:zinc transport system substrate-binding protein
VKKRALLFILFTLVVSIVVSSCTRQEEKKPEMKRLVVVATLFPLYDFAKNVAGERAEVTLLLPPGAEPHGFEPKPADIVRLNKADVFLYTSPDMEPWAADILKGLQNRNLEVVNTSQGVITRGGEEKKEHRHDHPDKHKPGHHDHSGAADPHIWLDFGNAVRMVENIRDGLAKKDPAGKDVYEKNAASTIGQLKALDDRFRTGLNTCEKRILVNGGHFAFDYMAKRYGFRYVSVYGISPDAEPTAANLAGITKILRENGLRFLYHEELINPKVAQMLAKEAGVALLKLQPAHNLTREQLDRNESFLSLMEENLKNLRTGMQCR